MRKQVLWLLLALCLLLSGCAHFDEYLEEQMLAQSKIAEDANYQTYQGYLEEGKLTQQGYHQDDGESETETTEGPVPTDAAHVTFADNSYLSIQYFSDAANTELLNAQSCYLAPGDSIYAIVAVDEGVSSSMYRFSGFRIYQYEDGRRKLADTVQPGEDGFILEISEELERAELSIEPIGAYEMRVISLRDYYTDDEGKEYDLPGTWTINDRQQTGEQIEVSPVTSYIISYEYDSSEYFYISSTPKCYYDSNEDGIIIFERRDSSDETEDYSVELHKYISAVVNSTQNRSVSVNNGVIQNISAGQALKIPKLRYGDTVILVTDSAWPEIELCQELVRQTVEPLADGQYRYTLTVPEKGGEFLFDPAEYIYEHGEIIFTCYGAVITTPQYLPKGREILYEPGDVDAGYWLAGGEHVIIVGDEEETRRQLNSICFIPSVQVMVALPQPEFGGRIRYLVDDKEITGNSYQTTSGTKIIMQFLPWEGWINNDTNGEAYEVTADEKQIITIGGNGVETAFYEDGNHKPVLEVVLDKSVGTDMQFSLSASGLGESDYHYENHWYTSSNTIIEKQKIGTEAGITLFMGGRAIQSGTAIKVLVEKVDSANKKTAEYRLIDSLTERQTPISIYEQGELGTSKVWYKTVKITISVVDVLTFQTPTAPKNASVTIRDAETREILKTGAILEGSAEVTVTIAPSSGYYVSGKEVKSDTYQKTMQFSKYLADIQRILDEHPIGEYYQITLVPDDTYGACIYKLDGATVTGGILVKEGQKLTLEYEITSDGYVIEGAKDVWYGIIANDQKKTVSVTITKDMNGQAFSRDTFGITVVKGE